ncbi:MAG TPA: hypothetical protein VEI28_00600 [Thermodesulfovibrionales bacterium]|nr:hypothetical protein [Thermodesulfovibrionales bacterium]
MYSVSKIILLAVLFFLTIAINFPFGYFRRSAKRYSFKWFLYIHIPIPFIFLMRTLSHFDFRYVPLFVLAAVIGQLWGSRVEF